MQAELGVPDHQQDWDTWTVGEQEQEQRQVQERHDQQEADTPERAQVREREPLYHDQP